MKVPSGCRGISLASFFVFVLRVELLGEKVVLGVGDV